MPVPGLGPAPFEVVKKLGAGTSATVFEAIHLDRGERVALKVFDSKLVGDETWMNRLQIESQTLRRLSHPNIVQLIDVWKQDQGCFLELELIEGQCLAEWMKADACPLVEPRLWILVQIARALGRLHEDRIIHRDLKPDNVMISREGIAKLTDFGLARLPDSKQTLTRPDGWIGSLAYMAPEVLRGEVATPASDIFAFGALAYELVCRRHPFGLETPQTTISSILERKAPPPHSERPEVPADIGRLISSCLETDPGLRPKSVWEIEARLMSHLLESGLLPFAKQSLAQTQETDLRGALLLKREKLLSRLQSIRDRKLYIEVLNEFSALFPQDAELPQLLATIATPGGSKRKSRMALVCFVVGLPLAILAGFVWLSRDAKTTPQLSRPNPTLALPIATTPLPTATPAPAPRFVQTEPSTQRRNSTPAVTSSATGVVRIKVDPDVKVYIDGRRLSKRELNGYAASPGRHQLLLEKEGFLPIEETIVIQRGKTISINAGGMQQ